MLHAIRKPVMKMILNLAMSVSFLLLMEPRATGLPLHEWGGLAVVILYAFHKMLNWGWIKTLSRGFFSEKVSASARLNYGLDIILLVGFLLIIVSGMAIARTIDFTWIFGVNKGGFWRGMHLFASLLTLLAIGIHIGLHWDWIGSCFKGLCNAESRSKEMSHA